MVPNLPGETGEVGFFRGLPELCAFNRERDTPSFRDNPAIRHKKRLPCSYRSTDRTHASKNTP